MWFWSSVAKTHNISKIKINFKTKIFKFLHAFHSSKESREALSQYHVIISGVEIVV
jgi:hypothetical protein